MNIVGRRVIWNRRKWTISASSECGLFVTIRSLYRNREIIVGRIPVDEVRLV